MGFRACGFGLLELAGWRVSGLGMGFGAFGAFGAFRLDGLGFRGESLRVRRGLAILYDLRHAKNLHAPQSSDSAVLTIVLSCRSQALHADLRRPPVGLGFARFRV